MKKFILGLILLPFALSINAQKGMHAVGANVSYVISNGYTTYGYDYDDGYCCYLNNYFSGGIKYQYYVTNYIRFSGTIKYLSTEVDDEYDKLKGFDVSLDSHLFITKPSRLRSYGILGLTTGYQSLFEDEGGWEWVKERSRLGVNYGLGIQFEPKARITLQMEAIGHIGFPRKDKDYYGHEHAFDNFQISIGAVYNI